MPADELQGLTVRPLRVVDPQSEADRIITQAKREADRMTAEAAARQQRLDRYLTEMSEEQLSRFVDETQIRATAEASYNLLSESARIRADFDAMGPWLEELLITCLQRIAGDLGERRMVSGILRQTMAEMQERDGLILHVAPKDAPMLVEIIEENPATFSAVEKVVETTGLAQGEIELRGPGGLLQLGLRSQLTALAERLRHEAGKGGT
ncbi:MAG: hypothetical protein AAF919_12480 [Pseudomonadota bacterium]